MCEAIQFGSVGEIFHVSSNNQIGDADEDQNACFDRSPDQTKQRQQEQVFCEDQMHQQKDCQYLGKQEHHLDIVSMGDPETKAVDEPKSAPGFNFNQHLYHEKQTREGDEDSIEEEDGSHDVPEDNMGFDQKCKSYDENEQKSEHKDHFHKVEQKGSVNNQEKGEKDNQHENIEENWMNRKVFDKEHIEQNARESVKNQELGGIDTEYKTIFLSTKDEDEVGNQGPKELNIHSFRNAKRKIKTRNIRNSQKEFSFVSYNLFSILNVDDDKEDETNVQIESIIQPPEQSGVKRNKSNPLKEKGKYPKKNEYNSIETREKKQKRLDEISPHIVNKTLSRCKKCFTNHTPSLPKFCRWSLSRKKCQEKQNEKQI